MSDLPVPTPTGGTSRPTPQPTRRAAARSHPNYAARRMLVSTVAITAIVAAGLIGWRAVRGDGGSSTGSDLNWDEIALVDRTTGAVTTVDSDGEPIVSTVGLGRVTEVIAHGDQLALVGADQIVLPGDEPVTVPIERSNTVTPVITGEQLHLVVGHPTGHDVTIVDAFTGDTIDLGALTGQAEPRMFAETLRHADDGTGFAVADAANFRTILVRPDDLVPRYFLGQPLAVGENLIATSQVIDREAEVALYDFERQRHATTTMAIPAGGVMIGDELLTVSVDGTVNRLRKGDEPAERLGAVTVPAGGSVQWVQPTADGTRLVVAGSVFEAVIDLEGATVFTTTFTAPVDIGEPLPGWTCLPVGGDGAYHSIISLESGEQLADLTGLDVTDTSADGCAVIGERNGVTEVVTADGTVRLGQVRSAMIGPGGRTVVRTTTTGITQLLRIGDELQLEDPIELTDAPSNLAVAFLTN